MAGSGDANGAPAVAPAVRHTVLSLGAGVQSTTLALMALRGDLPAAFPRPEVAIFADTGWEPVNVYAHLEWLTAQLAPRLPVRVVRRQRKDGSAAHIRDDTLAVVTGHLQRVANPPVYVKRSIEFNPSPRAEAQARFVRHHHGAANFVVMPLYARHFTGKTAMLRRQCTGDYKIVPIYRETRRLIGRRPGMRRTSGPTVEMWIGISAEESAKRCKPSQEPWVTNRYPLRELGLTRRDCERWLWEHYRRRVPKSACIGCPFHDDAYWRDMKLHRPQEWADAVTVDGAIRHLPMVQGECYLHRSCVPLDEVDLRTPEDKGQLALALFDAHDRCQW